MDPAAMRQALLRLGFSNDAENNITNVQGIDSADELVILSDTEIENLCRIPQARWANQCPKRGWRSGRHPKPWKLGLAKGRKQPQVGQVLVGTPAKDIELASGAC